MSVHSYGILLFRRAAGHWQVMLEWPRHSGTCREYPEIDAGRWFSLAEAYKKIHRGQVPFLERLLEQLGET
jgi:predicted NUDIX family NTP pyrophosphohydrolase